MKGGKLFAKALDIERVQQLVKDIAPEHRMLHLAICYQCIARDVMETMRKTENEEVMPLDALVLALELHHSGEIEFVEDDEGIIRAVPGVKK